MLKPSIKLLKVSALALACSVSNGASAAEVQYKDQQKLHDIAANVSAERIGSDIQTLVDFGTRHTLSETKSDTRGIGAARRWIKAEFEKISAQCGGCLEIIEVSDTISGEKRIPNPVEVVNIVAIQRGSTEPNRMVMMSGDIDSRVSDVMDFTSDSPGANDNASGVAGVIEAARVLSKYKFNGSVVYAALSGEEQGLFGGKILTAYAQKNNWQVHGVLNNDMIGNITGINGVTDNTTARIFSEGTRVVETKAQARTRRFTGGEVDSASRNLARYIDTVADRYIPNLDTMLVYRLDRFARGGHHRPFNDAGFAAVRIMETNEHYDRQHQDLRTENGITYGDTIDGVDFDYAAKLTSLNAVTMASMAWAPAPPKDVKITGAVKASTSFSWQKSNDDTVAGYKIYWRYTSEPQWQFSKYVGNVSDFTLENVVIDNYYFGVSSVSHDGFESPVVFPGDVGSFEHNIK
ncbi:MULTISPECIES: M28 family metallopeptidase [unclassified Pseudoalteromonas]|uniref:M28 family peptidase n=1 Tax=unclassified Pseudoalteromonas TaxID=194690 RepID=UPI001107EBFF|nr:MULTISPECIES: M28 family metallopeptidase [unclassified Pseudoalteromonas]TMN83010.1 peptidase M28 [Pseudoalteromonas sp. S410]TMN90177.1 peptidase M28 [Pseudoalteromonas sp. S408]TMN99282.1 peptidase M28 [Pseudoalteromonas sp. S409]TMO00739.1 peptidase M28 [Pseudoalteromonas sp. S407]TMO09486.1 peptidase M28 [Pseudoalteromonas sp. S186]